ncbi:autotransporter outer membrane beta-barrel domain-containing protein [Rickettsiales bacterium LUAb2]
MKYKSLFYISILTFYMSYEIYAEKIQEKIENTIDSSINKEVIVTTNIDILIINNNDILKVENANINILKANESNTNLKVILNSNNVNPINNIEGNFDTIEFTNNSKNNIQFNLKAGSTLDKLRVNNSNVDITLNTNSAVSNIFGINNLTLNINNNINDAKLLENNASITNINILKNNTFDIINGDFFNDPQKISFSCKGPNKTSNCIFLNDKKVNFNLSENSNLRIYTYLSLKEITINSQKNSSIFFSDGVWTSASLNINDNGNLGFDNNVYVENINMLGKDKSSIFTINIRSNKLKEGHFTTGNINVNNGNFYLLVNSNDSNIAKNSDGYIGKLNIENTVNEVNIILQNKSKLWIDNLKIHKNHADKVKNIISNNNSNIILYNDSNTLSINKLYTNLAVKNIFIGENSKLELNDFYDKDTNNTTNQLNLYSIYDTPYFADKKDFIDVRLQKNAKLSLFIDDSSSKNKITHSNNQIVLNGNNNRLIFNDGAELISSNNTTPNIIFNGKYINILEINGDVKFNVGEYKNNPIISFNSQQGTNVIYINNSILTNTYIDLSTAKRKSSVNLSAMTKDLRFINSKLVLSPNISNINLIAAKGKNIEIQSIGNINNHHSIKVSNDTSSVGIYGGGKVYIDDINIKAKEIFLTIDNTDLFVNNSIILSGDKEQHVKVFSNNAPVNINFNNENNGIIFKNTENSYIAFNSLTKNGKHNINIKGKVEGAPEISISRGSEVSIDTLNMTRDTKLQIGLSVPINEKYIKQGPPMKYMVYVPNEHRYEIKEGTAIPISVWVPTEEGFSKIQNSKLKINKKINFNNNKLIIQLEGLSYYKKLKVEDDNVLSKELNIIAFNNKEVKIGGFDSKNLSINSFVFNVQNVRMDTTGLYVTLSKCGSFRSILGADGNNICNLDLASTTNDKNTLNVAEAMDKILDDKEAVANNDITDVLEKSLTTKDTSAVIDLFQAIEPINNEILFNLANNSNENFINSVRQYELVNDLSRMINDNNNKNVNTWVSGNYNQVNIKNYNYVNGGSDQSGYVIAGMSIKVSNNLIGVAASYRNGNIDGNLTEQGYKPFDGYVTGFNIGLYHKYNFSDNLYLGSVVNYGRNTFKLNKYINIKNLEVEEKLTSRPELSNIGANVDIYYNISNLLHLNQHTADNSNMLNIITYTGGSYNYINMPEYKEEGYAALKVKKSNAGIANAHLGLELNGKYYITENSSILASFILEGGMVFNNIGYTNADFIGVSNINNANITNYKADYSGLNITPKANISYVLNKQISIGVYSAYAISQSINNLNIGGLLKVNF